MGMLVLGRLVGERIIIKIGDKELSIMLVEARAGGCRLGFDAPRDVVIMREELLQVKSYVNFRATEEDVLGYGYYCGACGRWSDRPANNVRCPNCGDEDEPPDPDLPLIGRCSTCGYSDDMEFICPLCGTAPLVKINPS